MPTLNDHFPRFRQAQQEAFHANSMLTAQDLETYRRSIGWEKVVLTTIVCHGWAMTPHRVICFVWAEE